MYSSDIFSILLSILNAMCSCSHQWGQNETWGAVRHVKRSGISIAVYLILTNTVNLFRKNPNPKNIFANVENHESRYCLAKVDFLGSCPEMRFRDVGHITDRFRPKLANSDAG